MASSNLGIYLKPSWHLAACVSWTLLTQLGEYNYYRWRMTPKNSVLFVCLHEWVHKQSHIRTTWQFVGRAGVCVGIKMCVGGLCVHEGPGEALQCIILLHLLYSSSSGWQRQRGCSVGAADMTAVALLFPFAGWCCCSGALTLMCFR